jgi:hypothetical protein
MKTEISRWGHILLGMYDRFRCMFLLASSKSKRLTFLARVVNFFCSEEPRPEDHVERSFLRQCLENAMATELSPNERDIVRLRLGLDDGLTRTAKEVADVCGGHWTAKGKHQRGDPLRFSMCCHFGSQLSHQRSPVCLPDIRNMEQRAFKKLRSPFAVHTHKLMAYLDFAGIGDGSGHISYQPYRY